MKRISLTLITLLLALTLLSSCFAAAGYNISKKQLNVSTSEEGFFEVYVDGVDVRKTLRGPGSITLSYEWEEGTTHVVEVYKPGYKDVTTIIVGSAEPTEEPTAEPIEEPTAEPTEEPTAEPTAEPTEEPTAEPTVEPTEEPDAPLSVGASYKINVINFTVNGLNNYAEVWLDGKSTNKTINKSGTYQIEEVLKPGDHTILIYVPGTGETVSATFEVTYEAAAINDVSYVNGILYFNVSNVTNYSETWLDNTALGVSVTHDGSYTAQKELSHDTHTLTIYNPAGNISSNTVSFVAHDYIETEGKDATCTESGLTAGIKCSVCDEVLLEQEEIPALGHTVEVLPAKAATCTESGLTEGEKCSVCGEVLKAQEEIPALEHDFVLSGSKGEWTTYVCKNCGKLKNVKTGAAEEVVEDAIYGNIVKDADDKDVPYEAFDSKIDDKTVVIVADNEDTSFTSEKGLYLSTELIDQLKEEGYEKVNYVNGEVGVVIDLNEIVNCEFAAEDEIDTIIVSTDPEAEDSAGIKVEALTKNGEKVDATSISGLILKGEDGDTAVSIPN